MIVVVGLSHKNAPLEIRERVYVPRDKLEDVLTRVRRSGLISEAFLLSTCNRAEMYAAPRSADDAEGTALELRAAFEELGGGGVTKFLIEKRGEKALEHLFRVAASLDSLVVGEAQILGQLKDALEVARQHQCIGGALGNATTRALRIAKRVRSETEIGVGQVSIPSVAIDLGLQIFERLNGHSALLVGAGEMAESAAKLLMRHGTRLLVCNRSYDKAVTVAREHNGEARPWDALEQCLVEADIVVTSTSSPRPILTTDLMRKMQRARRGRSLFIIDIAVPRDVEAAVNELENIYLYDIDDLSQVVQRSLEGRRAESQRAEAFVSSELEKFILWSQQESRRPTIAKLRTRTKDLLLAELERSLSGKLKHLSLDDRRALETMLEASTNKLLHEPISRLRVASDSRASELAEALEHLFELDRISLRPPEDTNGKGPPSLRSDSLPPSEAPQRMREQLED